MLPTRLRSFSRLGAEMIEVLMGAQNHIRLAFHVTPADRRRPGPTLVGERRVNESTMLPLWPRTRDPDGLSDHS